MTAAPLILVIEDDVAIRRGVATALSSAGYRTRTAGDGEEGLAAALDTAVELVLLDLVLPRRDGLEVLDALRRQRPALPLLILSARGSERDRVVGLRLGADDYVVKPFSVAELLARVEAVLRRSADRPAGRDEIALGEGRLDLRRLEARFDDGGREELTPQEVDLLRYLAARSDRAVSRRELLERVWRVRARFLRTRAVDMAVARLRRKLRDDGRLLRSVRGVGYQLVLP